MITDYALKILALAKGLTPMTKSNIFYAQSGGVTSVINATACGVIQTAKKHPERFSNVLAGRNGILGALNEELIDTFAESEENIQKLYTTPSGAFGSCRYKLKGLEENREQYQQLINVFKAHNIDTFFYNGGGDSQDTSHKVALMSQEMGYPMTCIGLPKTVDNDLPFTDNSPGFASVAKYVATSILEASLDVASMAESSTKVFIMEVMGRHAGWIAASGGLASQTATKAPHIILFPEIVFNSERFLAKVDECVKTHGFCAIVVSEGVKDENGQFLADAGRKDAFGHTQLGGVASTIASLIKDKLNLKYHYAICDYLQRAARHIASKTDVEQAYELGKAAVLKAIEGKTGMMLTIERTNNNPYQWAIGEAPLEKVANVEKMMPRDFISEDGFHITKACLEYLSPLIEGDAPPSYVNGLPDYVVLENKLVKKRCL